MIYLFSNNNRKVQQLNGNKTEGDSSIALAVGKCFKTTMKNQQLKNDLLFKQTVMAMLSTC